MTPIADAHMDSVPMVAITGQVNASVIGTDAFQEADIASICAPITKHTYLVQDPDEIPRVLASAFHLASSGRPGPVLVDITKSAQSARTTFSWPPKMGLQGYKPVTKGHGKQVREAAKLIAASNKPVFYIGGGLIKAEAHEEFRELAELLGAPVVSTLMGRGAFPDSHTLHVGMPGMHGTVSAVAALQQSDLLITLGARFDDRVTGQLDSFAPEAKVIHADVDPAEISKNRHADVPIVGSLEEIIPDLTAALRQELDAHRPDLSPWWNRIDRLRDTYPLGWTAPEDGGLAPQQIIKKIGEASGPEAIYASGVGQHQMWAAQFVSYDRPRQWLNSGGLGTMGYAVLKQPWAQPWVSPAAPCGPSTATAASR